MVSVNQSVYRTAGVEVGGTLPSISSIGCYTIAYYTRSSEPVCGECATVWDDQSDPVMYAGTYDEGPTLECCKCGCDIESSYGE